MGEPYRVPAPGPPDTYLVAWARLRRRRVVMRVAAIVLFVLVAPMSVLTWVPPDARVTGLALGLLLTVPVALFALSLVEPFRCPACHRPFFPSTAAEAGSARSCAHCGIEMGTPERKGTRWPDESDIEAQGRSPVQRASALLVATSLVAWASYELVRGTPRIELGLIPLALAAAVTTVVAGLIRSRAFPRELLMPLAGVVLASCLAAQVNRADRLAGFRPPLRTSAPCPTVGPRRSP
jgi:hypothetical protein